MNKYNEIKHEKIVSDKKTNDLLTTLIRLGNEKEKETVNSLIDEPILNSLTDTLATLPEGQTIKLINYIARETKRKRK